MPNPNRKSCKMRENLSYFRKNGLHYENKFTQTFRPTDILKIHIH